MSGIDTSNESVWTAATQPVVFRSGSRLLRGTITRANRARTARRPGVVLIQGSGALDRDVRICDVSIFAELAEHCARAGIVSLRYDKSGVGESDGAAEESTICSLTEDAGAALSCLRQRRDVASDDVFVLGHSVGAWNALLLARANPQIRGVILLAGIGTSGTALNIEQLKASLDRMHVSLAIRQRLVRRQQQIQTSVLTGNRWEALDTRTRNRADKPWFRSFLAFEPLSVIAETTQSILIVHGTCDRQVPPHHAERLSAAAHSRITQAPVETMLLDGLGHFLITASSECSHYGGVVRPHLSSAVCRAVATWILKTRCEAMRGKPSS